MLLKDRHSGISSSGEWVYIARSIVSTLTHVLARQPDATMVALPPDATMSTQCCELLTSLISTLPDALTKIGRAVTGLIREVAKLVEGGTAGAESALRLLLEGCRSSEYLPIVSFKDMDMETFYGRFTRQPVISKVGLLNRTMFTVYRTAFESSILVSVTRGT